MHWNIENSCTFYYIMHLHCRKKPYFVFYLYNWSWTVFKLLKNWDLIHQFWSTRMFDFKTWFTNKYHTVHVYMHYKHRYCTKLKPLSLLLEWDNTCNCVFDLDINMQYPNFFLTYTTDKDCIAQCLVTIEMDDFDMRKTYKFRNKYEIIVFFFNPIIRFWLRRYIYSIHNQQKFRLRCMHFFDSRNYHHILICFTLFSFIKPATATIEKPNPIQFAWSPSN